MLARQRKTGRREEAQGLVAGRVAADAPRALQSRWAGLPDAWHRTTVLEGRAVLAANFNTEKNHKLTWKSLAQRPK